MNDADLIVRIAARGDGVTADGRHAALAAPGDRLDASGAVHPGPHHAAPPCRHFPTCGGCQLQHVDDAAFADFATARIVGALHAQGLDAPEMRVPHISPPCTRRRASLRAERIGRRLLLGFNEAGSHRIVDLAECHVLRPELFALMVPLRGLLATLVRDRRAADVQMTLCDQGVDLLLGKVEVDGLGPTEALTDFARAHGLARLSIDDGYGPQARWEPDAATVTLGGVPVALPAGGFLQATADGEAALSAAVSEALGDAKTVADLFAGLGTFALPLSASVRVLAVEGARDAALALKSAAGRAGRPVFVEHRDLFRRPLDAKELGRFEAVALDPPRAGAKEQAAELVKADLARLAYVSCNPATFARDAKMLVDGGWRLEWIRPVGQFRWSTHIELAAAFTR
ncbi:RNA methyltransferase [Sphingomonas oleivorans]|uniref:RNA methyltransferase n=1 Tax=Sphingomonas oleivorans TaxID=1735121 RepID=A0A2T5FWT5_9SPHN|nr:class I SAM-dependent RNA methyltransferase [Sphingomonas oleivorans]PTQ10228.1 RNA methyltransferase [Sphingomonas oleivorans]